MTSSSRDSWPGNEHSSQAPRHVCSQGKDRIVLFYNDLSTPEATTGRYCVDDDDEEEDTSETSVLNLSTTNLGKWRNTTFRTTPSGETVFTSTEENSAKRWSSDARHLVHHGVIIQDKSDSIVAETQHSATQWKVRQLIGDARSSKGVHEPLNMPKRVCSGRVVSIDMDDNNYGNDNIWAKRIRFVNDVTTDNARGANRKKIEKQKNCSKSILTVSPPLQINNAINSGEDTYEGLVKSMKQEFFSVLEGVVESVAKSVVDEMKIYLAKKNSARFQATQADDRNKAEDPVVCCTNTISPPCCDLCRTPLARTSILDDNNKSGLGNVAGNSEGSQGRNFLHSLIDSGSHANPYCSKQPLEKSKSLEDMNIYTSLNREADNTCSGLSMAKDEIQSKFPSFLKYDSYFSPELSESLTSSDRPTPFVSFTRSSLDAELAPLVKPPSNIVVVSRQKTMNNDTTATTFSHIFSSPHVSIGKLNKHSAFEECKDFSMNRSLPQPLRFIKPNLACCSESTSVQETKPVMSFPVFSESCKSSDMLTNVSKTTFITSSTAPSTSHQDLCPNQLFLGKQPDVICLDDKPSLSQLGPIKKRPILRGQETSRARLLRNNLAKMERLIKDMGHNNSLFVVNKFQEGLTPQHLQKAKRMFFYTRYPAVHTLKIFFPDVKFSRGTTSQIIKWFSNFREFYYIHIERFVRQAIKSGMMLVSQLRVTRESELIEIFDQHYNKSSEFELPDKFVEVTLRCLQEIFMAIQMRKDRYPAWKKSIYKIVCQLDQVIPEAFKSQNPLQNLSKK